MDNDEVKRIITLIVAVVISVAFILGYGSGGGAAEAVVTV